MQYCGTQIVLKGLCVYVCMYVCMLYTLVSGNDPRANRCQWRLNRIAAHHAHLNGFPVFEREEIEHRLLFKSEFSPYHKPVNPHIHLDIPGPQIVSTALLAMVCDQAYFMMMKY